MAARRRKARNGEDGARAFAVVVEGMRGHFKAFGEKLDAVNESLSRRIDHLEQRMDARFDQVDGRLDRVEDALLQHTRQLKAIRVALDRKVDRDEVGR